MYFLAKPSKVPSDWAFAALVWSIALTAALGFLDGVMSFLDMSYKDPFVIWARDTRGLFEEGILAAAIIYIGTKILETRSVLSIGFDTVDAHRMSVKGPDEDNIVWIGRRYDSAFEAEAVAMAMSHRLDQKEKEE